MALAVLSRVAPFCAGLCLFLLAMLARPRNAQFSLTKNPTTISAIPNKRHIEAVHSFFDMSNPPRGESIMAWKTPRIVEIAVGMEINTYASAGL